MRPLHQLCSFTQSFAYRNFWLSWPARCRARIIDVRVLEKPRASRHSCEMEELEPMRRFILPVVVATATILAPNMSAIAASDPKPPNYHIAKTVALGAPDRWDYVTFDPGAKRVYVAHGDRVTVVDGGSGAVIGNVEGMPGGT